MDDLERARLVAHVLLDTVAAADVDATADDNRRVMALALQRLNQIGCVSIVDDGQPGPPKINLTGLVAGAIELIADLASQLAAKDQVAMEVVISQARERLDELA